MFHSVLEKLCSLLGSFKIAIALSKGKKKMFPLVGN